MIVRFLLALTLLVGVTSGERLNRYVKHFEFLKYNSNTLHTKHERARRSVHGQEIDLGFEAHGRQFNLKLRRGSPHIADNLIVETDEGASYYKPDFLYMGKLADKPSSQIHGAITNGIFQGIIYDGDEEYHIEPAKHHFKDSPSPEADAHSVIYKASDVEYPDHGGCGLRDHVASWMDKVQHSADNTREKRSADSDWSTHQHNVAENKYAAPRRSKRAPFDSSNTACSLFLQADHTFTAHYGGDPTEVIATLSSHVAAVNAIYINTNFGGIRGINFIIQRIRVNGTTQQADDTNPFRFEYIGVEKFLELNSLQDHSAYCLAYVFADRDFNDGVLGLAWVGSTGSTAGGICEEYKSYSGVSQSLNTGVVTIQNYGSIVASKVSHITFAHEIGHNFGSPHDYPESCRPGDVTSTRGTGNYIMYASATSGDKANNDEFSSCSIGNMSRVIQSNGGCFVESNAAICGNLIVDEGEECDCGYEDQCEDQCCDANTCRLVMMGGSKVQCSPSQGPCCTATCTFEGAMSNKECRQDGECSNASYCIDQQAACPLSLPKSNDTECNEHTQICRAGECTASICVKFGLEECFCMDDATSELDEACHICCQRPGNASTCRSSLFIPIFEDHRMRYGEDEVLMNKTTVQVLYQMPGAPCNEYRGYCDVFYKCRDVDSNGPLSRLTKAILNPELYTNIANWIQANWWAAVLIVLGVIIFMGLFIKLCSVHTPSSNPNLPKARKVAVPSTLRRRQQGRGRGQAMEMA